MYDLFDEWTKRFRLVYQNIVSLMIESYGGLKPVKYTRTQIQN